MQSDQQLSAAEKVAQEAESKKREAEYKAEMEQKAREDLEEKHAVLQKIHKEEVEAMRQDMKEATEEQARYVR